MKTQKIGQFTITQAGNTVSIKPGTCLFMVSGKELRNGECEYKELTKSAADYCFEWLVNYAKRSTDGNRA
jgi:hypothetical protein